MKLFKIKKRGRPLTRHEKAECAAVASGTKLLNKVVPGKWAIKVKLTDLELASTRNCVLGQLAVKNVLDTSFRGGYDAGLAALGLESGAPFGFDILARDYDDDEFMRWSEDRERDDYALLNELWAESIRCTRRGERVSSKSLQAAIR